MISNKLVRITPGVATPVNELPSNACAKCVKQQRQRIEMNVY